MTGANVPSMTFVIFGASGDLTQRKLIPALFRNYRKGRLPADLRIVGIARRDWSDDSFRERLCEGAKLYSTHAFDVEAWETFASGIRYFNGNLEEIDEYRRFQIFLNQIEGKPADRLYYLATAPELYGTICSQLAAAGMTTETDGTRRIVIEKPFGRDLAFGFGSEPAGFERFQGRPGISHRSLSG